ncbi:MAG: DUF4129 domain-containing protein [Acidilobaceae archaeon]|nr:DUF4129 domain-containing protein [Acidilobaceae archaeon]MCX8165831.1 DUF4129 domain-containing protein [Acidilobaceae archaeon]MDW7974255.1 DUF4129 domain-containing protein [Sulfolobales archaeon]
MKIAVLLLLVIVAHPAAASEPIAPKIHTYGFPLSVAGKDLDELLRQISAALRNLDPSTASSLESLSRCDTLECISKDPRARELIERTLSEGGLNIEGLREASMEELLDMIDDPGLREAISEMIQSGEVSNQNTLEILNSISQLYKGGSLSTKGYMAALEAVKRITERNMTLARSVELEQLQAIKRAIFQSDLMKEVAKKLAETNIEGPSFPSRSDSFAMPSLSVSLTPLLLLLAVLVTVPLAFLLFKTLNVERRLRIAMASISPPDVGARKGSVVALYWEAVKIVEAITGRKKEDAMTHREYLAAVRGHAAGGPFEEITRAYEQVRFGGRSEEELKGTLAGSMERLRRAG